MSTLSDEIKKCTESNDLLNVIRQINENTLTKTLQSFSLCEINRIECVAQRETDVNEWTIDQLINFRDSVIEDVIELKKSGKMKYSE